MQVSKFPTNKFIDAGIIVMLVLLVCVDANAQNTLKSTTTSIFTAIYEIIGVLGAIALLVMAINFKFHFIQNPMKQFLTTAGAVFLAFSVVAIVQFLKTAAGSQSINSL